MGNSGLGFEQETAILIASGVEPIEAVKEVYNYTSVTNAYGQLKTIMANSKVDAALKSLGMNLRDKFQKQGFALLEEMEKLHRTAKSEQIRYNALKTLMEYNPELQSMKKKDADDEEEERLRKRVEEWVTED